MQISMACSMIREYLFSFFNSRSVCWHAVFTTRFICSHVFCLCPSFLVSLSLSPLFLRLLQTYIQRFIERLADQWISFVHGCSSVRFRLTVQWKKKKRKRNVCQFCRRFVPQMGMQLARVNIPESFLHYYAVLPLHRDQVRKNLHFLYSIILLKTFHRSITTQNTFFLYSIFLKIWERRYWWKKQFIFHNLFSFYWWFVEFSKSSKFFELIYFPDRKNRS